MEGRAGTMDTWAQVLKRRSFPELASRRVRRQLSIDVKHAAATNTGLSGHFPPRNMEASSDGHWT